ncbi:cobyrinic acid a,c-diamide synthase [Inquilinus ginsengisoli]|uniref:Cobyrinate a,c-diamide synthase n=1 Tax=Inquilinus ginsengisoli TaxID=363840 RepID=A0ABU1JV17_9PROT|nr:cobyrinate a,c-diamide synthase [Inquilinus ginsengisoli]MDR6291394.1 cobyrinic acid a,c-diamide synthase [Inquilinus ginsengisoli]
MPASGLMIAAPSSGSGKTVVTLGLLRHLRDRGMAVASAKSGPDYIDPAFHAAASGRPCVNLDGWAMRPQTLDALAARQAEGADLLIVEAAMGLFDGAPGPGASGDGSAADLAARFGWPVVLVLDAGGQGFSAAAVLAGFKAFRDDVRIAGVIFNRVGSPRHEAILRRAAGHAGLPVLGLVPRLPALALPSRHLGLVQAGEHAALEAFLATAGAAIGAAVDVEALRRVGWVRDPRTQHDRDDGTMLGSPERTQPTGIPPLGQRIAVAADIAFAFTYPHLLAAWREAGAEILHFSPLADEAPDPLADAVYLPGGYPELHAGRLAANRRFLDGLRAASARGRAVYGECGGYMVLGTGLTDAEGQRHAMAGLLPVETSFAERRLHLGYRRAVLAAATPLGPAGTAWRGHEFHYASIRAEGPGEALFEAWDAEDAPLGFLGRRAGSAFGSFFHLIDQA